MVRVNKDRYCKNEVAPQDGPTYITFNASTKWYNWNETNNTEAACPNLISTLGNIKTSWVADLYSGQKHKAIESHTNYIQAL